MTSKLVVNTIESDTGISSVSFASSISMSSTSKFFFSAAGIDIGADTNINRPASGVLGFNINSSEKVRIDSNGKVGIATDTGSGLINTRHAGTNQQVLHVRADLGSSNGRSFSLYTPDTDNTTAPFRFQTGNGYLFQCDTEDVFTIAHDRKIGIGTNNPTEKFNIFGTNLKPVIGDRTAHTVHYSGYDSQNNTTLEISSSGTGTNVAGLTLNNPTTSANTSYKTLTFTCSGTSNAEKRGAFITSNHDAASGSAIKGNLSFNVNNGTQLQTAMLMNHQGHVQKAHTAMFSARGQGSWNTFNSGSGWYNLGDSSYSGSNYYINHSWTTSGGGCGVRGVTDAGNSIWENDKARFTAPVAGFYFFEINLYIRTFGGARTFHVQPWLDSTNLNFYTSTIGTIRNSSDSATGNTQEYPNSVMRTISIYMAANQNFRWSVYSEGTTHFRSHFDYAHQSGFLIG